MSFAEDSGNTEKLRRENSISLPSENTMGNILVYNFRCLYMCTPPPPPPDRIPLYNLVSSLSNKSNHHFLGEGAGSPARAGGLRSPLQDKSAENSLRRRRALKPEQPCSSASSNIFPLCLARLCASSPVGAHAFWKGWLLVLIGLAFLPTLKGWDSKMSPPSVALCPPHSHCLNGRSEGVWFNFPPRT